ncbi:MAG: gamma-glutamyltransferase [Rhodobacteraceae bacterium]|nr:gamma-glutamyltransferase [Paracoccaceae bacterium]
MTSALSRTRETRKTVIETAGGVVSAQNAVAARIGADVLRAGGDAVDAAVAVSFAMGVLEPWMSGPAGGGAAVHWRADTGEATAINFGMRSPVGLRVEDYPLSGEGVAGDLFPWQRVVEDRNLHGATAVAVPGTVAGVEAAHQRWGRMPWAELVAPAIAAARQGMAVDWYASLVIGSVARELARDADAAALFLDEGTWPKASGWTAVPNCRLDQSTMADSLDCISRDGAKALHGGDLGAALAADVAAKGGSLALGDLAGYRPWIGSAQPVAYRDALFHVVPGLTAGPTFARALAEMKGAPMDSLPESFAACADGLRAAYAERLSTMGDTGEVPEVPGCTTHFAIVDRAGNIVSHTQTLLSLFGSKVVSPATGFLLNNGIMWFDPEQGRPNSLAPSKACLMNVCPVIGRNDDAMFALGAAGGRKIVSSVVQLASFLVDKGMSLEQAFHHPRIDVSGLDEVVVDARLPAEVGARLAADARVVAAERTVLPFAFACPSGVMRKDGRNSGCTEIEAPWADTALEEEGQ